MKKLMDYENINNYSFIIFGKENCKYCDLAKKLLNEKKIEYRFIDIIENSVNIKELIKNNYNIDIKTVPQILMKNNDHLIYVGGYDNLLGIYS